MAERRCVVVAGFPRSGTSWLAKCLSFAPGFTHYREPDNFQTLSIGSKKLVRIGQCYLARLRRPTNSNLDGPLPENAPVTAKHLRWGGSG